MCISRVSRPTTKNLPVVTSLDDKESLKDAVVKQISKPSRDKKVHFFVEHHYHEHAFDAAEEADLKEESRGGVTQTFPVKLHDLLHRVEAEGQSHIISWQPHGRCFAIHKPEEFKAILPTYFKLSKIASFQRQLNLYGFQRITKGLDKGGYYHELFLRDKVFLAHRIPRVKVKGTGVRARSNPKAEPNFYNMPWISSGTGHVSDSEDSDNSSYSAEPAQPSMMEMDDDLIISWGKPFHYLDPRGMMEVNKPVQPVKVASSSCEQLGNVSDEEMDAVLDKFDYDKLVHDLFDTDTMSFCDLLDRAAV